MPMVIPLIAAGMSAYVGAGLVAGAIAAGTITAAGIVGGMMIASAALTALGTITGNRTMTKWGGVIGLAGGVAGLATGAFSAASSAAAEASAPSTAAASLSESATPIGSMDVAGPGLASSTNNLAPALSATAAPADALGGATDAAGAVSQAGQAASDVAVTQPSSLASNSLTPTVDAGGVQPLYGTDVQTGGTAVPGAPAGTAPSVAATSPGTDPSIFDKIKSAGSDAAGFMKANSQLVNTAGGLISGAMKSAGDQSLMNQKYQLQEDYDARQRARISASLKGLNMPTYQRPGA